MPEYLYAARNVKTGKLMRNLVTTPRKFWDRKIHAQQAIDRYNRIRRDDEPMAELVVFKLVEV